MTEKSGRMLADQIEAALSWSEPPAADQVRAMRDALLAVACRHAPDLDGNCTDCADMLGGPLPAPCYTVQDIAFALGIPTELAGAEETR